MLRFILLSLMFLLSAVTPSDALQTEIGPEWIREPFADIDEPLFIRHTTQTKEFICIVVNGGKERTKLIVVVPSGKVLDIAIPNVELIHSIAYAGNGKVLLGGSHVGEDRVQIAHLIMISDLPNNGRLKSFRLRKSCSPISDIKPHHGSKFVLLNAPGSGVVRFDLDTQEFNYWLEESSSEEDLEHPDSHFTLQSDYINDIAFVGDRLVALASDNGVSVTDLASGKRVSFAKSQPTVRPEYLFAQGSRIWYSGQDKLGSLSLRNDEVVSNDSFHPPEGFFIESFLASKNSSHVWGLASEGVALFREADQSWTFYSGKDWGHNTTLYDFTERPFSLVPNGKSTALLTSFSTGLALIDGQTTTFEYVRNSIEPPSRCSCLERIPNSNRFLSVFEAKAGDSTVGIFDCKNKTYSQIFKTRSAVVRLFVISDEKALICFRGEFCIVNFKEKNVVSRYVFAGKAKVFL